jgi:hypothetical protein
MNTSVRNAAGRAAMLCLAVALLVACATTTTMSTWKDPQLGDRRFASMLVVGVAEDQFARRKYEDSMSAALRARGVRSTTSYSLLPGTTKLDQEQIDEALARNGYEAVLVTHVIGTGEETVYYPGYYEYYRRPVFDSYYRYYTYTYDRVYRPGYSATFNTVSLETSLYQAPSGRVAWGMRTKSIEPENLDRLVGSLVEETINNLAASGLI